MKITAGWLLKGWKEERKKMPNLDEYVSGESRWLT
jgi:hypothetical protein